MKMKAIDFMVKVCINGLKKRIIVVQVTFLTLDPIVLECVLVLVDIPMINSYGRQGHTFVLNFGTSNCLGCVFSATIGIS